VLLLAAGVGTRLRPITDQIPKCLVPIAGRPLLDYWLDLLRETGLHRVLVNTHHLSEQVRDFIEARNRDGPFEIREAYEPTLLGSAGTVHANRDWVEDACDCLIIYSDNLSDVDLGCLLDFHRSHDDPITMMLFHSSNPRNCGIAELGSENRVVEFVEKPEDPRSDLANAGLYVVSAQAYREIADMNRFDLGHDVLPHFVGRMRGWVFTGYHRDVGTLEALRRARADAPGLLGETGDQ
jgi:mannose-1-phosphate guanylyltransferase